MDDGIASVQRRGCAGEGVSCANAALGARRLVSDGCFRSPGQRLAGGEEGHGDAEDEEAAGAAAGAGAAAAGCAAAFGLAAGLVARRGAAGFFFGCTGAFDSSTITGFGWSLVLPSPWLTSSICSLSGR